MSVLQINQLTKKYGRLTAVNGLSLRVEQGNVYGILGPNGSGKTTTLGCILGIIKANSGDFEWFGGRYGANPRRHIGALLETPNFYPYLNAVDNLAITAHIKKVKSPNIDEVLHLVKLHHRRLSKFKTYSFGMKQRLAIAAAMIGDPHVLIFDEPTNGLDPLGIAEVRQTINEIAGRGKTIIMASHILDEVEKVCSHVAIIKNGQLLTTGTVGAIINQNKSIELKADEVRSLIPRLQQIPGILKVDQKDHLLLLEVDQSVAAADINRLAFESGISLSHLLTRQKSLESEFLEITKDQ